MKVVLFIWTCDTLSDLYNETEHIYITAHHILCNQKERWSFSDKQKVHYILERKPNLETTGSFKNKYILDFLVKGFI